MQLLKRKVMICGANGLLGQNLLQAYHDEYDLIAVGSRPAPLVRRPNARYYQCDLTDHREVMELAKNTIPNLIINAAAFTDVDGSETQRERCWQVNATAVDYLAQAARRIDARIIHVSTDYVFDGSAGPYREDDPPNPLGYYGKAKLAGENAVISGGSDYAIARTMVLYGSGARIRLNFVTWLLNQLREKKPVRIVNDQFGNPTLASELAAALQKLAESNESGIFHLSGSETIDRYCFALKVAEIFELDSQLIAPITTAELEQQAPRPMNAGFDVSKAKQQLGIELSDASGGLKKFHAEMNCYEHANATLC